MAKYEMLYLLNNDSTEEVKTAVIEKYENIIKSMNGAVVSTDKWGAKKLAYPIKFKNNAYYVLTTFEAEADVLAEIERVANIDSEVLRRIITKIK
jgi:small subunit ribosomal protein S6